MQKLYKQIPKIFHNLSKAKLLLLGQMLRLKLLQIDNLKLLQNMVTSLKLEATPPDLIK